MKTYKVIPIKSEALFTNLLTLPRLRLPIGKYTGFTSATVTSKSELDFSEHDILSGIYSSRLHEERHFPLVEKIISDIF